MKKIFTMSLIAISIVILHGCGYQTPSIDEKVANEEPPIEKQGTNSMEEIIKNGNISNMEDEKEGKIKFHKFVIPSMNIAIYDANPNNPEVIVEDEQFNSDNEVEIPYYELETPLPDLVKANGGFIKMLTKDTNTDFESTLKSQDRKTILDTIVIDTNIDLGDINDIRLEKTDNKDLININDINNFESYQLVSNTSKYLFYIYYNKTKSDVYYLVGIADGCAPTPCGNIVSVEFMK